MASSEMQSAVSALAADQLLVSVASAKTAEVFGQASQIHAAKLLRLGCFDVALQTRFLTGSRILMNDIAGAGTVQFLSRGLI